METKVKVKVAVLLGAALNWAVSVRNAPPGGYKRWVQDDLDNGIVPAGSDYAGDWGVGGPIIEREGIELHVIPAGRDPSNWADCKDEDAWCANVCPPEEDIIKAAGPTPLVAAMRCWLMMGGEEIEVPERLVLTY